MKIDYTAIPPIRPFKSKIRNRTIPVREVRRQLQHTYHTRFLCYLGIRRSVQLSPLQYVLFLRYFASLLPHYSISDISAQMAANDFDLRLARKITLSIPLQHNRSRNIREMFHIIHGAL